MPWYITPALDSCPIPSLQCALTVPNSSALPQPYPSTSQRALVKKSFPGEKEGGFDVHLEVHPADTACPTGGPSADAVCATVFIEPGFVCVVTQFRKPDDLSHLSWVQKGDWGVSPQVLDSARVLFKEKDVDGDQNIACPRSLF